MNKINELLSEVKKCTNLHESKFRESGEDFNVYKLCGIYHNENPHSDILAEFLGPKGSHGCGCDFFRAFCQTVGLNFCEYENAKVVREYAIEGGRFDILIEAGQNKIVIENKIYAGEGEGQLKKYREWLNKEASNNGSLLFLTLDGRTSGELSYGYNSISYKKHIVSWLTECIRIAAEKPFVRESLIQYKNLIEELTEGRIMTIDKDLSAAIQKDFQSAIQVRNNVDVVKAEWLYDHILSKFEGENGLLKKYGLDFEILDGKDAMIANHDVFFSFWNEKVKVIYAFNSFGFNNPRREVYYLENGKVNGFDKTTRKTLCPHCWDDEFFKNITSDNAEKKAAEAIKYIVSNVKEVFGIKGE